jgi:glutamate/tyrosine decarboxylase-like PLP-dependent enzyme
MYDLLWAQVELLKEVPNGLSAIAVIVVVMLFLKRDKESAEQAKAITEAFNKQSEANQKAFQEQIGQLTKDYFAQQRMFQEQVQKLMDTHIAVTRETITILTELRTTVATFSQKLNELTEEQTRGKLPGA